MKVLTSVNYLFPRMYISPVLHTHMYTYPQAHASWPADSTAKFPTSATLFPCKWDDSSLWVLCQPVPCRVSSSMSHLYYQMPGVPSAPQPLLCSDIPRYPMGNPHPQMRITALKHRSDVSLDATPSRKGFLSISDDMYGAPECTSPDNRLQNVIIPYLLICTAPHRLLVPLHQGLCFINHCFSTYLLKEAERQVGQVDGLAMSFPKNLEDVI